MEDARDNINEETAVHVRDTLKTVIGNEYRYYLRRPASLGLSPAKKVSLRDAQLLSKVWRHCSPGVLWPNGDVDAAWPERPVKLEALLKLGDTTEMLDGIAAASTDPQVAAAVVNAKRYNKLQLCIRSTLSGEDSYADLLACIAQTPDRENGLRIAHQLAQVSDEVEAELRRGVEKKLAAQREATRREKEERLRARIANFGESKNETQDVKVREEKNKESASGAEKFAQQLGVGVPNGEDEHQAGDMGVIDSNIWGIDQDRFEEEGGGVGLVPAIDYETADIDQVVYEGDRSELSVEALHVLRLRKAYIYRLKDFHRRCGKYSKQVHEGSKFGDRILNLYGSLVLPCKDYMLKATPVSLRPWSFQNACELHKFVSLSIGNEHVRMPAPHEEKEGQQESLYHRHMSNAVDIVRHCLFGGKETGKGEAFELEASAGIQLMQLREHLFQNVRASVDNGWFPAGPAQIPDFPTLVQSRYLDADLDQPIPT